MKVVARKLVDCLVIFSYESTAVTIFKFKKKLILVHGRTDLEMVLVEPKPLC